MKFKDIPMLTRSGSYEVNVPLDLLEDHIKRYQEEHEPGLQMNPDFQRGHIWTESQQVAYVEFFLRGGMSSRVIYLNNPIWGNFNKEGHKYIDFVLVDGLQRLTALLRFVRGELSVFGYRALPKGATRPGGKAGKVFFEDRLRMSSACDNLKININNLQTRKAVLQWYLEMNSGGTPHTTAELDKVRGMLEQEGK